MATRLRFTITDDLCLLRKVVGLNPFENAEDWKLIHERVVQQTKKDYTLRCLKDHLDHLLKLFAKEDTITIKKSGTEDEYNEKHQLLQEIYDLRRDHKSSRSQKVVVDKNDKKKGREIRDAATDVLAMEHSISIVETEEMQGFLWDTEDLSTISTTKSENTESNMQNAQGENVTHDTSSAVLGPSRYTKKRTAAKDAILQFLKERRQSEISIKEKELALEERRLLLEEAKLQMEKEDRQQRRRQEQEEMQYRMRVMQNQEKLISVLMQHVLNNQNN